MMKKIIGLDNNLQIEIADKIHYNRSLHHLLKIKKLFCKTNKSSQPNHIPNLFITQIHLALILLFREFLFSYYP